MRHNHCPEAALRRTRSSGAEVLHIAACEGSDDPLNQLLVPALETHRQRRAAFNQCWIHPLELQALQWRNGLKGIRKNNQISRSLLLLLLLSLTSHTTAMQEDTPELQQSRPGVLAGADCQCGFTTKILACRHGQMQVFLQCLCLHGIFVLKLTGPLTRHGADE